VASKVDCYAFARLKAATLLTFVRLEQAAVDTLDALKARDEKMSNVGEFSRVASVDGSRATAEGRNFNWTVAVMALALGCTLAWNVALAWGLFRICQLVLY
jgi:hypothetical protein